MDNLVVNLIQVGAADQSVAGGKAAALGALMSAGFPVPPGFCVTAAAFRQAMAPIQGELAAVLATVQDNRDAEDAERQCAALLASLPLPDSLAAAVRSALKDAGLTDVPVAVRSSATSEDRADVSFAGQYETILGLKGEEAVLAAIQTCWRSFYSANAITARVAAGATGEDEAMALIVQRVVDAECAGVAFSVDPVKLRGDTIVIDAVWGLGIGAVDGSVETDTYWVHRDTFDVDEQRVVEKRSAVAMCADGGTGIRPVTDPFHRAACLPKAWIQRVAQFALAAEQIFGCPQDIEWAIAEGRIWLLQSRPITTLPADLAASAPFPIEWPSDEHRLSHWEREWFIGPVPRLPFDADAYTEIADSVRDSAYIKGEDVFRDYAMFNGRSYFRLAPSGLREGDRRVRGSAHRDLVGKVMAGGRSMWDYYEPEVVAATRRLAAVKPHDLDAASLAEHLEDAFGAHLRHWTVHWCMSLNGVNLAASAFAAEVVHATGLKNDKAELLAMRLSDGDETIFTRLVAGLYDLAQAVRTLPHVATLFSDPPDDIAAQLAALAEAAEFQARLTAFLTIYGDRAGAGFGSGASVCRPTWRDDVGLVLRMVAPYVDQTIESPAAARERALAQRDALTDEICAACAPEAAAALRRAISGARRQRLALEDHNHFIDQLSWGQLRRGALAVGVRMAERSNIAEPEDVFWLRRGEAVSALRNGGETDLRPFVQMRRAEHTAWCELTSPLYIGLPPSQLPPRTSLGDDVTLTVGQAGKKLMGIGASPGTREGRARVIPMGTFLPDLAPGEILVAVNAGPLWTPIFPILGGLVLDQGAPLQHAATTAREFGIPAVLQTGNGSRRIADGDWVIVDGTDGTVELVDRTD